MLSRIHRNLRYQAPLLVCLLAIFVLWLLPTGFEGALLYQEAERCTARVLEVDNSTIVDTGLVRSGEQRRQLELLDGAFAGTRVTGVNMLNGSLEQDKLSAPGDRAQVVVSHDGATITNVTMSDHYRLGWEAVLAACCPVPDSLCRQNRPAGHRLLCADGAVPVEGPGAALSQRLNPIWVGLGITLFLTLCIIALVYGFDRRCLAAVSGSFLGILVTCILGMVCTDLFQIHGAVMAYSESPLYSGYSHLNLTQIFMASVFLGSSGAVMDLSVDITSAVHEVVEKRSLTWGGKRPPGRAATWAAPPWVP